MMRLLAIVLLSSLWIPIPLGAQTLNLPDMGDFSRQYLSTDEERRLGSAVLQRLRDQGVIIEDTQLNEYLSSVSQRIAAYAEQHHAPFTFFWVKDEQINAFAAPGAFIGIHSGLMLATRSEDELAGVIAHEIAHVTQRHIARSFADAQRINISAAAALVASALMAAATDSGRVGSAAMATAMAASAQHRINFTRTNEIEADRVGTRLLQQAGFDPNGMATFFSRLERFSSGSAAQVPEFLRTHPLPRNRIADTLNRFPKSQSSRQVHRDAIAYYLAKARLRVLTTANTTVLIRQFRTSIDNQVYEQETAERYGYALALKKAGHYAEAHEQIVRLRKRNPDRLAFIIEAAEIAIARDQQARAWRLFENARRLYTDDFALAIHYGQALIIHNDARKAMQLLQPHLRRRPSNPTLHALYARAARQVGEIATTHATLADYYYHNGAIEQAIQQAKLGLRNSALTPYQQAQLRARLRQYETEKTP